MRGARSSQAAPEGCQQTSTAQEKPYWCNWEGARAIPSARGGAGGARGGAGGRKPPKHSRKPREGGSRARSAPTRDAHPAHEMGCLNPSKAAGTETYRGPRLEQRVTNSRLWWGHGTALRGTPAVLGELNGTWGQGPERGSVATISPCLTRGGDKHGCGVPVWVTE